MENNALKLIIFTVMTCKTLKLILLIIFSSNTYAQVKWSAVSPITWQNFKCVPDKKSDYKALTHTSIRIEYTCNLRCLSYKIVAVFNENKSWVADSSTVLLMHERDHFDIQEIFARKIRKYLNECYVNGISENIIHANVDRLMEESKKYHEVFDKDTNHSMNSKQQNIWDKTIRDLLVQLGDYSEAEFSNCQGGYSP